MQYDAIIIGAGIGGLFSASKLSAAGKKVLLIEKQPMPGGYATLFSRKGFSFESAVHSVDSLQEGGEMREFLEASGIAREIEFINLDGFSRVIFPQDDFNVTARSEDFINLLKEKFPQESGNITRLFAEFDKFYRQFDVFSDCRLPMWLKMALAPFIYPHIIKMSLLTIRQLIRRFSADKKLEALVTAIWGFMGLPPDKLSAFYFLIVFRGYYLTPTAYVKGGFMRMFRAMVKKIEEAGGEVRFNTAAARITTDKGSKVKGVITDKGEEFRSKAVISNANAIDTLCVLVDSERVRSRCEARLSSMEKSLSAFQVYLGLKRPAKDLGMDQAMFSLSTTYEHDESFEYILRGNYEKTQLAAVDHSRVDPGLVPAGKGSLLIFTLDTYSAWESLGREEYEKKKAEAAGILIRRIEKYLPGLSENIEVMEVATPLTMRRYSGCPEGAIYGFSQTVSQASINRLSQRTPVKGLFLAGAWTRPGGGVHGCFVSAMDAADAALRFLKR